MTEYFTIWNRNMQISMTQQVSKSWIGRDEWTESMRWVEEGSEGLEQLLNRRVNQPAARAGTGQCQGKFHPGISESLTSKPLKICRSYFYTRKIFEVLLFFVQNAKCYILTVISQPSAVMQWSVESALIQCFSGVKGYTNYVGIMIKFRFWYSGVKQRFCIWNKFPG